MAGSIGILLRFAHHPRINALQDNGEAAAKTDEACKKCLCFLCNDNNLDNSGALCKRLAPLFLLKCAKNRKVAAAPMARK